MIYVFYSIIAIGAMLSFGTPVAIATWMALDMLEDSTEAFPDTFAE